MRAGVACLILTAMMAGMASAGPYSWHAPADPANSLESRLPPPSGTSRARASAGSFAAWLRGLPLKPGRPEVRLFDGSRKPNQEAHFAVLDIDVGRRDLQQCADAVMRLRAEYLYGTGQADRVEFRYTSGDLAQWSRWRQGFRPVVHGSRVSWTKSSQPGDSYATFRRYLDGVFTYSGSWSLSRELEPVPGIAEIQPGDVFIQGGFPGHAVIVVDVAEPVTPGAKSFLLAQSYMPAQEIHILRNPANDESNPWYIAARDTVLQTPEWTFPEGSLKRFVER